MKNIKIISKSSPYYPKRFSVLTPSPESIFAIGNLDLLNTFIIGVVGARACTTESILLTKQLVTELANRGITILSGMADGIDTIAHETCLSLHGNTIAIIGSGFQIAEKRKIFSSILDNNGLILSEYFPDMPAFRYNFPRRNRLLVGLSQSIVAVETHLKSGTMITAKEALVQKVPLFTFPGGIHDNKFSGNNLLLTKGAICINSYEDVIRHLKKFFPNHNFKNIKTISRNTRTKVIPQKFQTLYSVLDKSSKSINEIAKELSLSIQEIQSTLTIMELENYAIKLKNNCYIKN